MNPTITLRSPRSLTRPDEREFQGLLRHYEVRERVEGRVRTLGGLYLAISALGILSACIAFLAIAPWGLLSGDATATALLAGLGGAIAALLLVISAPGLIGGLGLLAGRSWARLYAMVLSGVILLWFPLGTILGAYSLYVLLQPDTRFYFERRRPG
jgi:hypothetical protein